MRILLLVVLCAAATLTACSSETSKAPPDPDPENCQATGDEDGNGLSDCADPACAGTAACRSGCGNGRIEAAEVCDDGNTSSGDGCDSNCTVSACGNGILAGDEVCDDGNARDGDDCDSNCTPTACGNGIVTGEEECDDGNDISWDGCDSACTRSPLSYVKASNTDEGDAIGFRVALSADGSTLAVASELESSNAKGIDGDQANNDAKASGAVYIYVRAGTTWRQEAYVKASNTGVDDRFGTSVALSADGKTLAVGAFGEASTATNVDGDQSDDHAPSAGAAYVYTRGDTAWSQQAYVKASNTAAGQRFGSSVTLSSDGSTLAVGAPGEAADAGATYVFTRSDTTWSPQAFLKAPSAAAGDDFGASIALSADGATLVVGAAGDDASAPSAGAVYVFTRDGTSWSPPASVRPSSPAASDHFGISVALSADGATLAAGAEGAARFAGAAYVFTRSGAVWSEASVKASNAAAGDRFGLSIALSADGASLAVGAPSEASNAIGINGDQTNDLAILSGAVYVFTGSGTSWTQQSYVKASNTGMFDQFGMSVALSSDGMILAIGAPGEDSGATGINGEQKDDSRENGAVYVFR
jgi:cysteine-rich repeat protein